MSTGAYLGIVGLLWLTWSAHAGPVTVNLTAEEEAVIAKIAQQQSMTRQEVVEAYLRQTFTQLRVQAKGTEKQDLLSAFENATTAEQDDIKRTLKLR